jgi:hypothetical protein
MVDSAKLDRKQTKTDSASHDKSKQREFEQKVAKVTKRNQVGVWKMIIGQSTNTRSRGSRSNELVLFYTTIQRAGNHRLTEGKPPKEVARISILNPVCYLCSLLFKFLFSSFVR